MHIIKNSKLQHLDLPVFNCDELLGKKIPPPFPNQCFFMIIVGKPRSGKSSLAISLLQTKKPRVYRKIFDNIITCIPPASVRSLRKNPFKDLAPGHVKAELSEGTVADVIETAKEYAEEGDQTLFFIDDQSAYLKSKEVQVLLRDAVNNRRHYHLSIMLLSQNLLSIPLDVRKSVTHAIMFKCPFREWDVFCNEYLDAFDNEERRELYNFVFDRDHNFIFVDLASGEVYKKFDQIVFDNDS